ncbi:hypothetical protein D3C80_1835790 [compost metagenome]
MTSFLRRLEQDLHSAGQLGFTGFQQIRGTQNDRGMKVVAAGVHFPRNFGRKRQTGLFLNRKSINIAADSHYRPFLLPDLGDKPRWQRKIQDGNMSIGQPCPQLVCRLKFFIR